MIAGNCFSAVAYLSRFGQRPQRYAARRLYLLLKRIPYKTQAKSNFFHGPEYIQFVFPPLALCLSFCLFHPLSLSSTGPPSSLSSVRAFDAISPGSY